MIKKIFLTVFTIFVMQLGVFADEITDVKAFFQSYVDAANTYQMNVPDFYLTNAKITRVVHKKDGTKVAVNFPMADYTRQMKLGAKMGKMIGYKNVYTNRAVAKVGDDYRITAIRTPGTDTTGLACYFVVTKTSSGYKFREESMDTKVQDFLKSSK